MNIDDLTIGEGKQLAQMFTGQSAPAAPGAERIEHGIQIAVLDKGFVYVGEVATDGAWVYITRAVNVRRWGTTKGLGELVNGPTRNTELDVVGSIRVPFHALQHLIAVEADKWTNKLA